MQMQQAQLDSSSTCRVVASRASEALDRCSTFWICSSRAWISLCIRYGLTHLTLPQFEEPAAGINASTCSNCIRSSYPCSMTAWWGRHTKPSRHACDLWDAGRGTREASRVMQSYCGLHLEGRCIAVQTAQAPVQAGAHLGGQQGHVIHGGLHLEGRCVAAQKAQDAVLELQQPTVLQHLLRSCIDVGL